MNDDHLAERRAAQLGAARGDDAFDLAETVQSMDLREGKVARLEYVGLYVNRKTLPTENLLEGSWVGRPT